MNQQMMLGKQLLETIQANNGIIWNRSALCKGFFTRKPYGNQKGDKTAIDYVIQFGENVRLQNMIIDDNGDHWWSSDHSIIITRMVARKVLQVKEDNNKVWKMEIRMIQMIGSYMLIDLLRFARR